MRSVGRLLLLHLLLPSVLAIAQVPLVADFSSDELRQVISLGPWPPPQRLDPGNRVSGKRKAIELGRRLFRDPRMSAVGYISCVSCHQPDRSFTDAKARAHGLADLPRNTPALANLGQQRWYGWGGSSDSLWMASIRPILDPREFDGSLASISRLFERDPELAACYRSVFGVDPLSRPQRTAANVGKALAAFQETLVTARTPFDELRDALARNDGAAAAGYPADALRGLQLFVGRAGCIGCHKGPNFTDGDFHQVIAVDADAGPGAIGFDADSGRLEGVRSLQASPLNLLGRYNDDPVGGNAAPTRALLLSQTMRGQFRTPSLRNVAVTGPYLHDGRFDSLADALQHPTPTRQAQAAAAAAALSAQQLDDLTAFLRTLTDRHRERRPWSSAELSRCP